MTRSANETPRARRAPTILLLLIAAACACDGPAPPSPVETAAVGLFALARVDEPSAEALAATFETPPGPDDRAALLDALAALAAAEDPQVLDVQTPEGPDDAWVDLSATLAGGGAARYSVRLRAVAPGAWRVTWFQGPGVAWPRQTASRDEGLTSSAPPESPR